MNESLHTMTRAANAGDDDVARVMLDVLRQRGLQASACPSEVARLLSPNDWRAWMPKVRDVASQLAGQGLIEVTQKGRPLAAAGPWKGPIRIRLPRPDNH